MSRRQLMLREASILCRHHPGEAYLRVLCSKNLFKINVLYLPFWIYVAIEDVRGVRSCPSRSIVESVAVKCVKVTCFLIGGWDSLGLGCVWGLGYMGGGVRSVQSRPDVSYLRVSSARDVTISGVSFMGIPTGDVVRVLGAIGAALGWLFAMGGLNEGGMGGCWVELWIGGVGGVGVGGVECGQREDDSRAWRSVLNPSSQPLIPNPFL
ncbi:hypothetical protein Tco_0941114 [Tanacetum coccineum]|uniref:Uncharacterized protein n=1 Tax=Tanacetum coccineum TaxID=301880 RepID=A0ABQ5DVX2_9ASTR